ncbi:MAG: hypothetical protein P9L98_00440 [Candidatus Kaelpia imicola]|nr:hypothetical protein [Candidatus Kaelpia imicola]
MAQSASFLKVFSREQRLDYLLFGEYGIDRSIPDSLKTSIDNNIRLMMDFRLYIDRIRNEEFTPQDRFEFEASIDLLDPDLVSDEIKDIMKKEIDMLLEETSGNKVAHPLPLTEKQ